MAFPVIESAVNSSNGTAATSNNVTLPATISAGALLCVLIRIAGNGATAISLPAGWSSVQSEADASDDRAAFCWRDTLAAGTEDSSTIAITHGSGKMAAVALSITGAADPAVRTPELSTVATGTSTTPDPSTCTPTGGAKDYKWLWCGTWEGEQTSPPAGAPTNYTTQGTGQLDANSGTGGVVATNVRVVVRQRDLNAASEDPPSWTISASDDWMAWTVAVHPPAPATGPPTPRPGRAWRRLVRR